MDDAELLDLADQLNFALSINKKSPTVVRYAGRQQSDKAL